jgi:hypothetical protein
MGVHHFMTVDKTSASVIPVKEAVGFLDSTVFKIVSNNDGAAL